MILRSHVPYRGLLNLLIIAILPGLAARGEIVKTSGVEDCCKTSVQSDPPIRTRSSTGLLPNVTYARIEPFAIRIGLETARLVIGVDDPAVVAVKMPAGNLSLDGNWNDFITLVDDGSQGDDVAGDGLFTRDQLTIAVPYENSAGNPKRNFRTLSRVNLTFIFGDGHEEEDLVDLGYVILIGVDPGVEIPSVVRSGLAENIHNTEYVVNIVQELESDFPDYRFNFENAAKQYYAVLPDDRDFLIFAIMFNWKSLGGRLGVVDNDVEGLGLDMYDNSSEYGSAGVLEGVMTTGYPSAPLLNHELFHRWGVYLSDELNLGANGHWNAVMRTGTGFNLTSDHINNGIYRELVYETANDFRAWHIDTSGSYNDLELYLMGLIPISEVETPIQTLVNPVFKQTVFPAGPSLPTERYDIYEADEIRAVQTQDIINAVGPRVPDHLNSQKAFKSALIVVFDRPLTNVEFAALDYQMREYEKPTSDFGPLSNFPDLTFQAATGGRATLQTRILSTPTGIDTQYASDERPQGYMLHQNYPNPFNPQTTIRFELIQATNVTLTIYNLMGQEVARPVSGYQSEGTHEVIWNSGDHASGVYLYELRTADILEKRKMLLMR